MLNKVGNKTVKKTVALIAYAILTFIDFYIIINTANFFRITLAFAGFICLTIGIIKKISAIDKKNSI